MSFERTAALRREGRRSHLANRTVFVASSVAHMLLPFHHDDYKHLPDEEKTLAPLREAGLSPGQYMFPACTMKDMKSPETIEKYNRGPVGIMILLPNRPMAMGKNLVLWFVYCLIVGIFTAYVGYLTLSYGTSYILVFRVTGAVAALGYSVAAFQESIWKGVPWSVTFKFIVEGFVYSLLAAGVFGWLWPTL